MKTDNQNVDVVILGTAHPLRGGLANYNHRLAEEYLAQGYKVKLISFSLQYPNFLFPGKSQFSDEPSPKLDIETRLSSINPFTWISVGNYIKKLKPQLLIIKFWIPFMGPALGTVARIARKNKVTKVVSIIDNIIPHEHRIGDRLLANYFIGAVHGFVTMSDSVLKDLRTFTSKPALMTPHPIYDNFGAKIPKTDALKQLGLATSTKYMLFFGFIRDYKGLDLLLQAMADVRVKNLDVKLIVAGEFYTDSKPYFDIISSNKIESQVVMATDFIPDSKVGLYFSACDLVVQPYKDATQSGVTQVAYSFEKPMVVTNVGGLSEIVPHGKTGYVVDVDPEKIADAIVDFFENHKESEMVANCAIEKQKYSWSILTEKIENIVSFTN
ncbi:MAG: glycosyltransferase [Bacteroidales bacterium]|nr:glycosyltransferase [Bacteroidales bacterium]